MFIKGGSHLCALSYCLRHRPARTSRCVPPMRRGVQNFRGCVMNVLACAGGLGHGSFRGRRRGDAQVDQLESEAGDPLHEPVEGALIW